MRLAFWQASCDGSSWYRATLPGMALGWREHEVWASEVLPPSRYTSDVIIASRPCKPDPSELWQKLAEAGANLVFDIDDDYWHIDPSNAQAFEVYNDPGVRARLRDNVLAASVVTCVSNRLAQVIREKTGHERVVVVPNGLHAGILAAPREYFIVDRPIRLGLVPTGSTIHEVGVPGFLRSVERALETLKTPTGTPWLHTVGSTGPALQAAGFSHGRISGAGWVLDPHDYLGQVSTFDIWLAPYRDTPYNQAKFPTKALEAGFLGIPLIASDIEPYRQWIKHGETGFLVREPHQWGQYIRHLVTHPDERERVGLAARAHASQYALQSIAEQWEKALP